MMVDAENKVLTLVEFKPEGSLARGLRQVGQYADDVRDLIRKGAEGWKQYQGYDIQTKVTEYPK